MGKISTGILRGSQTSITLSGSATFPLTEAQAENEVLVFTGSPSAAINVTIPDAAAPAGTKWLVYMNTGGNFPPTLKTVSGTGVTLPQGRWAVVESDGTNLRNVMTEDVRRSAIVMGSDANLTLSTAQAAAGWLDVTSSVSLTATRNVVVPLCDGRVWDVTNGTTGAQSIQIIPPSGTGITIANGKSARVGINGTNVIRLTDDTT